MTRPGSEPSRSLAGMLLALSLVLAGGVGCTPADGFVSSLWFTGRQLDFLRYETEEVGLRPGSVLSVIAHLERSARDPAFVPPEDAEGHLVAPDAWDGVFDKMWRLRDTSDFNALELVNLLHGYRGHPAVPGALWQKAEQALVDFKYRFTDPTPDRSAGGEPVVDDMWYWTENHELIFRTCEYLAGLLLPDRTFSVTGLSGAEHAARALPELRRWIDERARLGFAEWHSDVYYQLDLAPLLSLVEWSADEDLAERAAMMVDLVLLDVALHLHRGYSGGTRGRTYPKDYPSADLQDTFWASKLLFDDTELPYPAPRGGNTSPILLARTQRYRLPEVLLRIARDDAPLVDRERMGLPIEEAPPLDPSAPPPPAPLGYAWDDDENLPLWWSMNGMTAWPLLPMTLRVAEEFGLWDAQFSAFKELRDSVWVEGDIDASVAQSYGLMSLLWPAVNEALLEQVNTYTYRTRDYILSTAQDYRKGLRGYQQRPWQATLGERAMVFTTHPGRPVVPEGEPVPPDFQWRDDEPGPGYWTGDASLPRAAQFENVAVVIYAPQYRPNLLDDDYAWERETHAYFPVAHFDEVVQEGPWTFGRKDDGYVALYSFQPTEWRRSQPEVFRNGGQDWDLVAPGKRNVWIAECGSADEWPGGFEAFRAAVAAAEVVVTPVPDQGGDGQPDGYDVVYASPSLGPVRFGWHQPLVVNGVEVRLDGHPRMENAFVRTEFGEIRYAVDDGEYGLVLDFATGERSLRAPVAEVEDGLALFGSLWRGLGEAVRP